jgi:hypothetical protein
MFEKCWHRRHCGLGLKGKRPANRGARFDELLRVELISGSDPAQKDTESNF